MAMKYHLVRPALLLTWIAAASSVYGVQPCAPITQRPKNDGYVQDQGLTRSGYYCLKEDIFVKGHRSIPEGGRIFNVSKIIVNIGAHDVVLDLDGHTAWSDGRLEAGLETTLAEQRMPLKDPPRNVTVRGGTLRLERSGIGIRFSGLGGLVNDKWPIDLVPDRERESLSRETEMAKVEIEKASAGRPLGTKFSLLLEVQKRQEEKYGAKTVSAFEQERESPLPPNAASYPVRNLRIENMRIRTQASAAVLQGGGTVIRNSVIEVDAGTALWIYGPGAVIEDNTIVVHGKAPGPDPLLEADAPIRLIQADGAIVRNNRIVAADAAHKRAISLFDTRTITVESNRFEGMAETDEWVKAFRGTADVQGRGNTFRPVGRIHAPWWERVGR